MFSKTFEKSSAEARIKFANNVMKNPGKTLRIGAKRDFTAPSGNSKAASSTIPEILNSNHTGKGLCLGFLI